MPAGLADRPVVPDHLALTWEAFGILSEGRPWGPGGEPLPIGFAAVDAWARRYGISDPEEFDELLFLVRRLDAAYRERAAKP